MLARCSTVVLYLFCSVLFCSGVLLQVLPGDQAILLAEQNNMAIRKVMPDATGMLDSCSSVIAQA
jgi:hypothetical protein